MKAGDPVRCAPGGTASADRERGPLDYDFEVRSVVADGVEIAYVDEGPRDGGLPLVLVHGIGATIDHWTLAIPRLAARRRVVALDLPGFGRSAKPDRRYEPETFAASIEAFLAALDLPRIVLMGHSMGGAITAEYTLLHRERVERLILVDAAGMTRMPTRLLEFLVRQFERNVDARNVKLPERMVRGMARMMFFEPPPFADRNARRILASMGEGDWPERVRSFVRSATGLSRSRVRERLGEFDLPTLIIWGERDRILPVRHGRALHEGIRGSRIVTFADTGHCPQIERVEPFVEAVEAFLGEAPR